MFKSWQICFAHFFSINLEQKWKYLLRFSHLLSKCKSCVLFKQQLKYHCSFIHRLRQKKLQSSKIQDSRTQNAVLLPNTYVKINKPYKKVPFPMIKEGKNQKRAKNNERKVTKIHFQILLPFNTFVSMIENYGLRFWYLFKGKMNYYYGWSHEWSELKKEEWWKKDHEVDARFCHL